MLEFEKYLSNSNSLEVVGENQLTPLGRASAWQSGAKEETLR